MKEEALYNGARYLFLGPRNIKPEDIEPSLTPPRIGLADVFEDSCFTGYSPEVSLRLAGYDNTPEVLQQLRQATAAEFARTLSCLSQKSLDSLWESTKQLGIDVPANLKHALVTEEEATDFFISLYGKDPPANPDEWQKFFFIGVKMSLAIQEDPIIEALVNTVQPADELLFPPRPFEDARKRAQDELMQALDLLYDDDVPLTIYYIEKVLAATVNSLLVNRLADNRFIGRVDESAGSNGLSKAASQQKPSLIEAFLTNTRKGLGTRQGRAHAGIFFCCGQEEVKRDITSATGILEMDKAFDVSSLEEGMRKLQADETAPEDVRNIAILWESLGMGNDSVEDRRETLTAQIASDEKWHELFERTITFLMNQE